MPASGQPEGIGGDAIAVSTAQGSIVQASATAHGGQSVGNGTDGAASALANGDGASGTVTSNATLFPSFGEAVLLETADASADVSGSTASFACTAFSTAPIDPLGIQATSIIEGLPSNATVAPVLATNAAIADALGTEPTVFAAGELAGGGSAGAAPSQTENDDLHMDISLSQIASPGELILGLFGGNSGAGGFSSLTFEVDGTPYVNTGSTRTGACDV